MSKTTRPTVSVVIPLYYAEAFLAELIARLEALAQENNNLFHTEIVFVDDGSKDKTFETLRTVQTQNFRFKAIRFARNFKSYIAILAGIKVATGDYITCLPQDLQEPPELVEQLWSESEKGFDVVWAVRGTRSDPFLSQVFSNLFHRLMHRIWSDWPETGADVFMINRPVADVILSMQEKNSHITGQILWSGFRQTQITYTRKQRKKGKSGWGFWKKFELAISVITQFSYLPIRLCTALGSFLAALGFLYGLAIAIAKFTLAISAPGWSALMIVVLILGGFQLIFLGVIGEYLWRIFDEVRKRPVYIIRETID